MQQLRHKSELRLLFKATMAGVLAVLLGGIGLLSANSELHHRFCASADTQEHQCAVTLFSQGQVDALDGASVLTPLISYLSQTISPAIEAEMVSVDFLLLPERGPPCLFS